MKFIDEVKIFVKAGAGGSGCTSFRREKFVPKGGPDGGDGGKGGNVILEASDALNTLLDLRYQQHYLAKRGVHGKGKKKHGKSASDLIIPVPLGTLVKDEHSTVLYDLTSQGERITVAKGGRGGRGNAKFTTSVNTAPRYAEEGEKGEERWLKLELKLLADVGIIGFPNTGKSTLVSKLSAAKPKIADYPFTTLTPTLGVVRYQEGYKSFIIADIPGLIEGAHRGTGLGIRFLRHIERTRLLLHLIDISVPTQRDPIKDYTAINKELALYSPSIGDKPQIIAVNKMDISGSKERFRDTKKQFDTLGIEIHPISAKTGEGTKTLIDSIAAKLSNVKKENK